MTYKASNFAPLFFSLRRCVCFFVCHHQTPGAPLLILRGGSIEFQNVSFGYDPAVPILKGISFRVEAGQRVAIVGPSGAGE